MRFKSKFRIILVSKCTDFRNIEDQEKLGILIRQTCVEDLTFAACENNIDVA